MVYSKPPIEIDDQIKLLKSRGLVINDEKKAGKFLLSINYYRLIGYGLHFEEFKNYKRTDTYLPDTTFEDIVDLYQFDTSLRNLLLKYISIIEIDFRSVFCHYASLFYKDSHWYLSKDCFNKKFDFHGFLATCHNEAKRNHEIFIRSYYGKYKSPVLPAIWMMTEILSLGKWSMMYSSLYNNKLKSQIAGHYKISPFYLENWIHCITTLRNHCAHHNRLWNRNFSIAVKIFKPKQTIIKSNNRLGSLLFILLELLKATEQDISFRNELKALFAKYKNILLKPMGLSDEIMKLIGVVDE